MLLNDRPLRPTSLPLGESSDRPRLRADQVQEATYQISQAASSANDLSELFQLIHTVIMKNGMVPGIRGA